MKDPPPPPPTGSKKKKTGGRGKRDKEGSNATSVSPPLPSNTYVMGLSTTATQTVDVVVVADEATPLLVAPPSPISPGTFQPLPKNSTTLSHPSPCFQDHLHKPATRAVQHRQQHRELALSVESDDCSRPVVVMVVEIRAFSVMESVRAVAASKTTKTTTTTTRMGVAAMWRRVWPVYEVSLNPYINPFAAPAWGAPAAPAPAPAAHGGAPAKGAGGMFDTRDPEPKKDEDPRKSISEAPSFEEYMKMRNQS